MEDERFHNDIELLGRDAARRIERFSVGRLQLDSLHGKGRPRLDDRFDRRIERNVERRPCRRRDRDRCGRLIKLALPRLLPLLFDDQLRRILNRTDGRRGRGLRKNGRMHRREGRKRSQPPFE
nr:hypothetical protein [Burkholderia ambifaria]